VIEHEKLAGSEHAWWNLVNRPATHIVITLVEGIHRRIGIGINRHINGRSRTERVVQCAESAGDRSILIVAVPVTLPELAGVTAAIAAEERVTTFRFDDAQGSVRPGEAIGHIRKGRLRRISGGLTLSRRHQHLVRQNLGRAERDDVLGDGRGRESGKHSVERDEG
jgi:hypothetical protein